MTITDLMEFLRETKTTLSVVEPEHNPHAVLICVNVTIKVDGGGGRYGFSSLYTVPIEETKEDMEGRGYLKGLPKVIEHVKKNIHMFDKKGETK